MVARIPPKLTTDGLLADRPAPTLYQPMIYFCIDTHQTFVSDGNVWTEVFLGPIPPWTGALVGCCGNGDPLDLLLRMQQEGNVNPNPHDIGLTVARVAFFSLNAPLDVARIRWYGVDVVTGVYHVAVYRASDLVRMSDDHVITTTLFGWDSVASAFTLTANTLYFVAVSVESSGNRDGIRAYTSSFNAATSLISGLPTTWPGNLGLAAGKLTGGAFAQFPVVAGALPAVAPLLVTQAAWIGGMPAFFLDANGAA